MSARNWPDPVHAEYLRLRKEKDQGCLPYYLTNKGLREMALTNVLVEAESEHRPTCTCEVCRAWGA